MPAGVEEESGCSHPDTPGGPVVWHAEGDVRVFSSFPSNRGGLDRCIWITIRHTLWHSLAWKSLSPYISVKGQMVSMHYTATCVSRKVLTAGLGRKIEENSVVNMRTKERSCLPDGEWTTVIDDEGPIRGSTSREHKGEGERRLHCRGQFERRESF